MSPVPERQPRGGVGTAELLSRGQGEESRTLSPRSKSDLLSTPFLPKNTFLAKSPREEGDPFPGKAAGGAAAALAPPEPGPGRRGARAAPYPACPPLLPCLSLNGRRGRHFESEERRRRRRRRFSYLEPVCCSMSSSNCCFLTCIQVSPEAGQVVWYSHLFQNFPQFIVIHTVKGFGIVNKAEINVFLELSCFF